MERDKPVSADVVIGLFSAKTNLGAGELKNSLSRKPNPWLISVYRDKLNFYEEYKFTSAKGIGKPARTNRSGKNLIQ